MKEAGSPIRRILKNSSCSDCIYNSVYLESYKDLLHNAEIIELGLLVLFPEGDLVMSLLLMYFVGLNSG